MISENANKIQSIKKYFKTPSKLFDVEDAFKKFLKLILNDFLIQKNTEY